MHVLHILLGWVFIVQVRLQMLSDVRAKLWKNLTSKHVPVSFNLDSLFVLEVFESGVLVAPALSIEEVNFYFTLRVIINDLWVGLAIDSYRLSRDLIAPRKVIV